MGPKQPPAGEGRGEAEIFREQQPRGPETPPLPFVPPSNQPVELFKRSEALEGREGGGGGSGTGGGVANMGGYANGGMTAEKARAENQWHSWKLETQVKKAVEALTLATVNNFGVEIQNLLCTHSSAQKLRALPGSKGPVWPVLHCVLTEGVRREGEEGRRLLVEAVRSLVAALGTDVCQLLQPVLEELAMEFCEQPSPSKESVQRRQSFCTFMGKLFLDASYSQNKDYASVMGHVIRHYLNTWSKCPAECQELQLVTQVECLSFLCQEIGPTIDVTNRETLDQYFEGVLMHNVLDVRLPRSVCKLLFQLCLKRAAGWVKKARLSDSTLPTPTPAAPPTFSQDTPTLTANGQQVLQPIPVDVPQSRTGIGPLNSAVVNQDPSVCEGGYPARPAGPSYQSQFHPQTTAQSSFQTANHSSYSYPQTIPAESMNMLASSQLTYQTVSSQYQPQPTQPDAYSAVREMLQSLGLSQLIESCMSAMITDLVLECGNQETLRAGLKDAGFQPGAIISVLDYLERRRRTQSLPSTPSTPQTPQPLQPLLQQQIHHSPYTPHTPAPSAPLPPPQQLHQHQLPSPSTHHHLPSPSTRHQLPSPSTHHPSQQHYPPLVKPSLPHPSQQPRQPTIPFSPPSQFTPTYPLSMRLPTPAVPLQPPSEAAQTPHDSSQTSSPAASNQSVRKYGFGAFTCVLCRSQDHRTEQCPDRDSLFFKSS